MKTSHLKKLGLIVVLTFTVGTLTSCSDDDDQTTNPITGQNISEDDKEALLFMLEEEKLARDTYYYLDSVWSINTFANIKQSEQQHMDAVENLIKSYSISYQIEPMGVFQDTSLQNFYNQFIANGVQSKINALTIGATIEDLDIVDLREFIAKTDNQNLIAVFQNLECGSKNHLRSFVKDIVNEGSTYTPQFLTQPDYDLIINSPSAPCN